MSMQRPRPMFALFTMTAAAALALTGCGGGGEKAPEGGDAPAVTTIAEGRLTVCSNPPYAPFESTEQGEIVGFDLSLMEEVAKDLGLQLAGRETPFEAIESAAALDIGDCDVGASALTITEARQAKADFSQPYYDSAMGMLVGPDSGIDSIDNLEGKTLGVQQGTTGEGWAKEHLDPGQVRQYEHLGDQTSAFQAGDVDGIINDVPTLQPYAVDGATIVTGLSDSEVFGFMVKKGNTALLNAINSTLDRVKTDGTYERLIAQWFTTAIRDD